MIGILVNNEYLDLAPGTSLDLEQENPFLQLGAEIRGEYSLPFSVPASEKNMRLLGYPNLLVSKKITAGIPAILFQEGLQHSTGQIKLETGSGNINHPQRGQINLYYLFGISDFYKLIENKTLEHLDYGADISKVHVNADDTAENTLFGHFSRVMAQGNYNTDNYAVFPIVNQAGIFTSVDRGPYAIINAQNSPGFTFNTIRISHASWRADDYSEKNWNEFTPFPYLTWVINKAFEKFSWTVDGEIFNDPDFRKIVLLHNRFIDWRYFVSKGQPIVFNMRDHVPLVKISSFLISLANRFGWWFAFDYQKKSCTIKYRRNILRDRKRTDLTAIAGAQYNFKLNAADKIYALSQSGGEAPVDFSKYPYTGFVGNSFLLPTPIQSRLNDRIFVSSENAWHICSHDDANNKYYWEKLSDNTTDVEPAGYTDEITTGCLVPDSMQTELANHTGSQLLGTDCFAVHPLVNIPVDEGETDTFYICYHHGPIDSFNKVAKPDIKFAFGSADRYNMKGGQIAAYSLALEHPDGMGLYKLNWEYFLRLLLQREEITIPLALKAMDFLQLDFTNTILIRNAEYFIKNPHFSLPLKSVTNVDLIRIQ